MTALVPIIAALLFLLGVLVAGLSAWVWTRALADVFRAKSHRISVDAQGETLDASAAAMEELTRLRSRRSGDTPTDEDLRAAVQQQYAEEEAIPPDRLFVDDGE